MRIKFRWLSTSHLFLLAVLGLSSVVGECELFAKDDKLDREYTQVVEPFMQRYCIGCHQESKRMAGLRLDDLQPNISTVAGNANLWHEVMDRIALGEMPPRDDPMVLIPDDKLSASVADWIAEQLKQASDSVDRSSTDSRLRRLNRDEYANTVADLLGLDRATVQSLVADLPGEGSVDGFNNIASGLMVDPSLVAEYLVVATKIADLAVVSGEPAYPTKSQKYNFRDDPNPKQDLVAFQKHPSPVSDAFVAEERKARNPGSFDRGGEAPVILPQDNGTVKIFSRVNRFGNVLALRVPTNIISVEGDYRLRIRAGAFPGRDRFARDIKLILQQGRNNSAALDASVSITAPEDSPEVYEMRLHLKPLPRDEGDGSKPQDGLSILWNGLDTVIGNPDRLQEEVNFRKPGLSDQEKLRRQDNYIRLTTPQRIYDPKIDMDSAPRLVLDWIEIQGPIYDQWPPASYRQIFFPASQPSFESKYLEAILTRLLSRAYRRPATQEDLEQSLLFVKRAQANGASVEEAIKHVLEHVLCSPHFIYLRELPDTSPSNSRINDFELASRLSYFLWSSMPDDELHRLAESGDLTNSSRLREQVTRMLADPKSAAFVKNFAGQWLQLRSVGSIQPDARLYVSYHRNGIERWSIKETYAFFDHILRSNLSILNFLDSDFALLNEPMAKFYGIDGVVGEEFRVVKLPAKSQRGGLVSQASILSLGSDGVRTKPVTRAKWVVSTLFNDPPNPPPANAGEVEPNSAGESFTVRQRLDRHRTVATCASCHTKLDPFGLGLENYNAVGAWRIHQDGENFKSKDAPVIDASGELKQGLHFDDSVEYRQALMELKDKFTKGLTEKMFMYALGRRLNHSDRDQVGSIVQEVKAQEYRLISMIQAIVASPTFQSK